MKIQKTEILHEIRLFQPPLQSDFQHFSKTDAFVPRPGPRIGRIASEFSLQGNHKNMFYLYFSALDLGLSVHSYENDKVYKCVQNIHIFFNFQIFRKFCSTPLTHLSLIFLMQTDLSLISNLSRNNVINLIYRIT